MCWSEAEAEPGISSPLIGLIARASEEMFIQHLCCYALPWSPAAQQLCSACSLQICIAQSTEIYFHSLQQHVQQLSMSSALCSYKQHCMLSHCSSPSNSPSLACRSACISTASKQHVRMVLQHVVLSTRHIQSVQHVHQTCTVRPACTACMIGRRL